MDILDIHSHHPAPYPQGVISQLPTADFVPLSSQFYSIGLHPWHTAEADADQVLEAVEQLATDSRVVAIGECGVDPLRGAPMFRQMLFFRRQVEISEKVGKPMVIHAVKSPDVIIGIRADLQATLPWAIHGFRGKPTVAAMYLKGGMYLSFGERFNPETLQTTPRDRILAETDEASLPIESILQLHASAIGMPVAEYTALVAANTRRFLTGAQ